MRTFQRIHMALTTALMILFALFRAAIGLALIGGSYWLYSIGFNSRPELFFLALLSIGGVACIVGALGVFAGAPHVEPNTRLETRDALRRAGMLGRR
jgi:hypothetical protein